MKLAVITSHPVQYYAPWFRHVAASNIDLRVFYLWDFGVRESYDPGFARSFVWDIPLLDGYDHEFVPNTAHDPGTHHAGGLVNPSLIERVRSWGPDAVLLMGYAWKSMRTFILRHPTRGCPLLLRGDSHDLARTPGIRTRVSSLAARWIFRRFSAFLACGTANTAYFLNRGAPQDRVFFCPHAVDMNRFQRTPEVCTEAKRLRGEWQVPHDHRLILFAGKFEEKKQPLALMAAFRALPAERTTLVFVGAGPQETALRAAADGHPHVRIRPFANQSLMPAVYAAADLFVLPSLGASETWGLAVQEALSCGTPVLVSSHVGCHPDLVHDGINGAVFPAGSTEMLARALGSSLGQGCLQSWQSRTRTTLDRYNFDEATRGLKSALAVVA